MAATQTMAAVQAGVRVRDGWVALILGVLTVILLVATEPQIGLTWDEPVYTVAQDSYVGWLRQLGDDPSVALSKAGIQAGWEVNHEHPPLDKLWSGLISGAARGWLGDLSAYRLGNMLLVGMLIALIYLMAAKSYGPRAGLLAAAALLSMPRFFFHAHLAALDVPGAVAFFVVISLFWHTRAARGLWPSVALGMLLGLVWGIGLATKINAAFALPVLALWALCCARRWGMLVRLTLMTAIGPWVFVLMWPWLYVDTWKRIEAYIRFITVDHWKIDQWYFGQSFMPPPWHFPFVMLLMALPLTLLLLSLVGVVRGARQHTPDRPVVLWVFGALLPLAALTTGQSMVYDNERLFMPTFPFLALLAGAGLDWALSAIRDRLAARQHLARGLMVACGLAVFAPQIVQGATLYPHLLSYYSEAVGGLPGATRLGMETTYWCESYAEAIDQINAGARPGAVIWAEDWSHDVLLTYQQIGRLRGDLRIARVEGSSSAMPGGVARSVVAGVWEADYAIVQIRESGLTAEIDRFRQERTPTLIVERQGVVLMELYERR